ncbi:MAG: translesion DNA synthesis-associated protein ImuA [Burkholderiales bacterium]
MHNNNNNTTSTLPTGFAELDVRLPGGGWPRGALTEIVAERLSVGELRLLTPAAARLTREGRWLALIAPPCGSAAAMLAAQGANPARLIVMRPERPQETLRVCEQVLRAGHCGMVLCWPGTLSEHDARKLAQAAADSGTAGFLLHNGQAMRASTAALRLSLAGRGSRATVRILQPATGPAPVVMAPVTLDLFMGVSGIARRSPAERAANGERWREIRPPAAGEALRLPL